MPVCGYFQSLCSEAKSKMHVSCYTNHCMYNKTPHEDKARDIVYFFRMF